ncbi:MAG TPA: hypothetical protein VGI39_13375 [Polyangiaceae bacterium]|jgi:hypothetical protein
MRRQSLFLASSLIVLGTLRLAGCKASASGDTPPLSDAAADAGSSAAACTILFGRPNAQTGLGSDQCRPECSCGDSVFAPPTYDDAFVQSLIDDWTPSAPYAPLTSDPYASPAPPDDPPGTVCAVLPGSDPSAKPRPYTLMTYPSEDAANAAGAKVTHFGRCGVCSTLANLAVYMRENDLTAPARACGVATSSSVDAGPDGGDPDVICLEQLGFDLPCAQAWAYDTANTRRVCLGTCLSTLNDPYNEPDGALNPCIQCDEDQSGPIFKLVAGRTRRNSGLPNAICRPCSEVQPLVHDY